MSSFAEFYQHGGIFMHVITLLSVGVGIQLLRRLKSSRRAFRTPEQALTILSRPDALTPALLTGIVLCGALGTVFGFIAVNTALDTVARDLWPLAASRGLKLAAYPLSWGLMCSFLLLLAHAGLRQVELRLTGMIERRQTV